MDFRPQAEQVSATREFVSDFYRRVLDDDVDSERVALAAHELLENAVKYASGGTATMDLELSSRDDQSFVSVRISNRASPENCDELKRIVDELQGSSDPMDLYLVIMKRSVLRTEGAGLGLARIRAEAEMDVSCTIDGDLVTVSAEAQVKLKAS